MNRWPRYAAALFGFAWFLAIGGGPTLDTRNFLWLLAGDWLQHWLGWLFFQQDPWSFPLGRISSLLYPVGTNIGFTDSNPLVAIPLKLFAGLLPKYFQFIGPWLAACFVLQGYVGAALTSVVTRRPWQQFLGGCLFALSPVLAARLGHDTLCAHWLILGLLYLGLRECPEAAVARRLAWLALAAATLSASIHPYLAAMCWVLAQAVYVRLWRLRVFTLPHAAVAAALTTVSMLAVFGAIGYFGGAGLSTSGFGNYSSNVLTLVSPMGYSRLLPAVDVPATQWEGFGYLGAGGIVLCVLATVVVIVRRPPAVRRTWPVLTVCVLMAVYAVSTVVMVGTREVLRIDLLTPFATPFRSSGRFIWSFHYLLLLGGIWGVMHAFGPGRQRLATVCLAAAVVLQAADLKVDPYWLSPKSFAPAAIYNIRGAIGHYRHVALVPARVFNVCGGDYDEIFAYRYMYLAYRLNSTYNSGIFARVPEARVLRECLRQDQATERGELDSETIYVVAPHALPRFDKAGATCSRFRDDWVCVSRDSHEAFRRYLLENGGQ
jgi:hypothetical protein